MLIAPTPIQQLYYSFYRYLKLLYNNIIIIYIIPNQL